ncbi:hypothetical protein Fmac_024910 [Flemingia macrophylla]|uniref:Uncharacterized protein n=1 Tax=Flemingia macrophylla TaxID=520843 RepID=A0ABD1LQQ7_9FABA
MSIQRLMPQTSIGGDHSSRGKTLDREDGFQLLAVSMQEMIQLSIEEFTTWLQIHLLKLECFSARNDAIFIRGVHDVATDTSVETRKVAGKLDPLVKVATIAASSRGKTLDREDGFQLLAVSVQETMPLSLKEFTTWLQIHLLKLESFSARNDAIVIRGVHDVATDTSIETRKVEGKLDALVNLVTQLAVTTILPMTTIQMSVLLHSNLECMSILRLMLQTSIAGHHSSRGQTLDREDGLQLLAVSVQEMIPLSFEEFTTWLQINLLRLERRKAS